MPTPSSLRRALPAVLLAASFLIAGCAGSDHQSDSGEETGPSSSSPAARPSAALPDGIAKPGSALPVSDGAWTVALQGFEQLPAQTSGEVPTGSRAYVARMTMKNTRPRIATAPRTEVTARYGALGRQAEPVQEAAAQPSPSREPVKVGPNGSVTQEVRVVFPEQAQGQPVTVTVEATPEGLAQPELLFFESPLPGRSPAAPEAQGPGGGGDSRQGVTPLGQWNAGLRLSTVTVAGEGDERTARLELSVANRGDGPLRGLGTTLRVFTGRNLHLASTIHPVYGYRDAAIAPHRTATQTVTFRVPQSAVGGPVTIEAVGADGSPVSFQGTLG